MPSAKSRAAEIAIVRPSQPRSGLKGIAGATERRLAGALEVPLEQVAADSTQPRRDWSHDEGEHRLEELAASIREFGILQPLLVREDGTLADGRARYAVIAGGRRYAAAQRIGLATVPVVVHGAPPERVRVLQLIENLQRQDLSPLDEARAYQELIDLEGWTPPVLAAQLHLSAQHVRDRLRVLADQVLADAVERRQIAASTARDLMQLPDEELQSFRARVAAGERLQINDVATARARLAAAGITNPRRRIARPAPPSAVVEVPPVQTADSPEQQVGQRADEQAEAPTLTAPASPVVDPVMAPPAASEMPAAEVRRRLAALNAEGRQELLQILQLGAQAKWSCAMLFALATAADPSQE